MKTVITFGTFDVFHVGHLRLLQRARKLGERLLVGVSSDALTSPKRAGHRFTIRMTAWRLSPVWRAWMAFFWRNRWSRKRSICGGTVRIFW